MNAAFLGSNRVVGIDVDQRSTGIFRLKSEMEALHHGNGRIRARHEDGLRVAHVRMPAGAHGKAGPHHLDAFFDAGGVVADGGFRGAHHALQVLVDVRRCGQAAGGAGKHNAGAAGFLLVLLPFRGDFRDGILPADALPLIGAALSHAAERVLHPLVGIGALRMGQTLRAHAVINRQNLFLHLGLHEIPIANLTLQPANRHAVATAVVHHKMLVVARSGDPFLATTSQSAAHRRSTHHGGSSLQEAPARNIPASLFFRHSSSFFRACPMRQEFVCNRLPS